MDVRIGYSVDLDNVPDKVADMLSELSLHKAGHLIELAMHMIELGHHEMGLTLIEDARKMLSEVDKSLHEAHSIVVGYMGAKAPPKAEKSDIVDSAGEPDVD